MLPSAGTTFVGISAVAIEDGKTAALPRVQVEPLSSHVLLVEGTAPEKNAQLVPTLTTLGEWPSKLPTPVPTDEEMVATL